MIESKFKQCELIQSQKDIKQMQHVSSKKLLRAPPNLHIAYRDNKNTLMVGDYTQNQLSLRDRQQHQSQTSMQLSRIADKTQRTSEFKQQQQSILNDFGVLLNSNNNNDQSLSSNNRIGGRNEMTASKKIEQGIEGRQDKRMRNRNMQQNRQSQQTARIQHFQPAYNRVLSLLMSATTQQQLTKTPTNPTHHLGILKKTHQLLAQLIQVVIQTATIMGMQKLSCIQYEMVENVALNYWKVGSELFFQSNNRKKQLTSRKQLALRQQQQNTIVDNLNIILGVLEKLSTQQQIKATRLTSLCLILAKESLKQKNIQPALQYCERGFMHCSKGKSSNNTNVLLKLHYMKSKIYEEIHAYEAELQEVKKCLFLIKGVDKQGNVGEYNKEDFVIHLARRKQQLMAIVAQGYSNNNCTNKNINNSKPTTYLSINYNKSKSMGKTSFAGLSSSSASVNKFRKRSISLSKFKLVNNNNPTTTTSDMLKDKFKNAIKKQMQSTIVTNNNMLQQGKKDFLKLDINRKTRLKKKGQTTMTVWQKNSEKISFQNMISKQLQSVANQLHIPTSTPTPTIDTNNNMFKNMLLKRPNQRNAKSTSSSQHHLRNNTATVYHQEQMQVVDEEKGNQQASVYKINVQKEEIGGIDKGTGGRGTNSKASNKSNTLVITTSTPAITHPNTSNHTSGTSTPNAPKPASQHIKKPVTKHEMQLLHHISTIQQQTFQKYLHNRQPSQQRMSTNNNNIITSDNIDHDNIEVETMGIMMGVSHNSQAIYNHPNTTAVNDNANGNINNNSIIINANTNNKNGKNKLKRANTININIKNNHTINNNNDDHPIEQQSVEDDNAFTHMFVTRKVISMVMSGSDGNGNINNNNNVNMIMSNFNHAGNNNKGVESSKEQGVRKMKKICFDDVIGNMVDGNSWMGEDEESEYDESRMEEDNKGNERQLVTVFGIIKSMSVDVTCVNNPNSQRLLHQQNYQQQPTCQELYTFTVKMNLITTTSASHHFNNNNKKKYNLYSHEVFQLQFHPSSQIKSTTNNNNVNKDNNIEKSSYMLKEIDEQQKERKQIDDDNKWLEKSDYGNGEFEDLMNAWLWREIDQYNSYDKNSAINNALVWKIIRSIECQRSATLGYELFKQKTSTITNHNNNIVDNDLDLQKKRLQMQRQTQLFQLRQRNFQYLPQSIAPRMKQTVSRLLTVDYWKQNNNKSKSNSYRSSPLQSSSTKSINIMQSGGLHLRHENGEDNNQTIAIFHDWHGTQTSSQRLFFIQLQKRNSIEYKEEKKQGERGKIGNVGNNNQNGSSTMMKYMDDDEDDDVIVSGRGGEVSLIQGESSQCVVNNSAMGMGNQLKIEKQQHSKEQQHIIYAITNHSITLPIHMTTNTITTYALHKLSPNNHHNNQSSQNHQSDDSNNNNEQSLLSDNMNNYNNISNHNNSYNYNNNSAGITIRTMQEQNKVTMTRGFDRVDEEEEYGVQQESMYNENMNEEDKSLQLETHDLHKAIRQQQQKQHQQKLLQLKQQRHQHLQTSLIQTIYQSIYCSYYPKLKYLQLLNHASQGSLSAYVKKWSKSIESMINIEKRQILKNGKMKKSVVNKSVKGEVVKSEQSNYQIVIIGGGQAQDMRSKSKKYSMRKSQIIQINQKLNQTAFLQQVIKSHIPPPTLSHFSNINLPAKLSAFHTQYQQSLLTKKYSAKEFDDSQSDDQIEPEQMEMSYQMQHQHRSPQLVKNNVTVMNKSLHQSSIHAKPSNFMMVKILKKALIQPDYKKSPLLMTYFDSISIQSFRNIMGNRPNYIKLTCFRLKTIYVESQQRVNFYYLFELQQREARTRMHKFIIGDQEVGRMIAELGGVVRMGNEENSERNMENWDDKVHRTMHHTRTHPGDRPPIIRESQQDFVHSQDNKFPHVAERVSSQYLKIKKPTLIGKLAQNIRQPTHKDTLMAYLYHNRKSFLPNNTPSSKKTVTYHHSQLFKQQKLTFTQSCLTQIMSFITPLFVIKKDYIYTSIYLDSRKDGLFYLMNKFSVEHEGQARNDDGGDELGQVGNSNNTKTNNNKNNKKNKNITSINSQSSQHQLHNSLHQSLFKSQMISKGDFLNKQIKSKRILCQKSLVLNVTQCLVDELIKEDEGKQVAMRKRQSKRESSESRGKRQSQLLTKQNKLYRQSQSQQQQLFSILTIIKISQSQYFTIKLYIPRFQRSYTITLDKSFVEYLDITDLRVIFGKIQQTKELYEQLEEMMGAIKKVKTYNNEKGQDSEKKVKLSGFANNNNNNQNENNSSKTIIARLQAQKKQLLDKLSSILFEQQHSYQKMLWNNVLSIIKIQEKKTHDKVYLTINISTFSGFVKDCSFLEFFEKGTAVYMIEMSMCKKSKDCRYFPKEEDLEQLVGNKIKRGVLTGGGGRANITNQNEKQMKQNKSQHYKSHKHHKKIIDTEQINSHNQQFQKLGFIYESKTQAYTLYVQIFKIKEEQKKELGKDFGMRRRLTNKQSICDRLIVKDRLEEEEEDESVDEVIGEKGGKVSGQLSSAFIKSNNNGSNIFTISNSPRTTTLIKNSNNQKTLSRPQINSKNVSFHDIKSNPKLTRKQPHLNTIKSINFNLLQNSCHQIIDDDIVDNANDNNNNRNLSSRVIKLTRKPKPNYYGSQHSMHHNSNNGTNEIEATQNTSQIKKINFSFYLSELNSLFKYIDENYSEEFNEEYFVQAQINTGLKILGNIVIDQFKGLNDKVQDDNYIVSERNNERGSKKLLNHGKGDKSRQLLNQKVSLTRKDVGDQIKVVGNYQHSGSSDQGAILDDRDRGNLQNHTMLVVAKSAASIPKKSQVIMKDKQLIEQKQLHFTTKQLFHHSLNQKLFKQRILLKLQEFDAKVKDLQQEGKQQGPKQMIRGSKSVKSVSEFKKTESYEDIRECLSGMGSNIIGAYNTAGNIPNNSIRTKQRFTSLHNKLSNPNLIDLHILPRPHHHNTNKISSLFYHHDSLLFLVSSIQHYQIYTIAIKLDQQHPFAFINLLKDKGKLDCVRDRLFVYYRNLLCVMQ